jgi:hypothetical protein
MFRKPRAQDHAKSEFGKATESASSQNPLPTGGVEIEKIDTGKKSGAHRDQQEENRPPLSQSRHEDGKESKKLNDEAKVPPSRIEIEKVIVDP